MRLRHFSPRTEDAYLGWMRRYHEFHGRRNPAQLGPEHVTAFLNALATRGHVAASTQNQALEAIGPSKRYSTQYAARDRCSPWPIFVFTIPIRVFTIRRSRRSRWSETSTLRRSVVAPTKRLSVHTLLYLRIADFT